MKKLLLLPLLVGSAMAACATGIEDVVVNGDVALTEADSGPGARLPARDASGGTEADASDATDASDAGLDAADAADAKDSGADSSVTGACGAGSVQLGEYTTWSGKVNVHRATAGSWVVDTDCSSGSGVNTVTYCKKFWPTTTKQVQLATVSADLKPFTSGGGSSPACGGVALGPGHTQYACCVP